MCGAEVLRRDVRTRLGLCHSLAMAKATITLHAKWQDNQVLVDVHNATGAALTLVTHSRYLVVEVLDKRGQFVRGEADSAGMPTKADFVDVPARGQASAAFRLDVQNDGDELTIGRFRFRNVSTPPTLRLTYKSGPVVPNLPSNKRRSFFRGPAESERCVLST